MNRIHESRVKLMDVGGETCIVLPQRVIYQGSMRGDSGLVMDRSQAEALHGELCHVLSTEAGRPHPWNCDPSPFGRPQ
ncbi:hypothetical protein ACIRQY_29145 [Streptomyces sp. NPDC101490]|uniref:hypothetical protein n=1 Tax=Streptomyces sp. NPDC101490 TaxID=3366143 RepID=UPI0037FA4446